MTDQEINEAVARKLGWTELRVERPEGLRNELVGKRNDKTPPYGETVPDYCHSIEAAWEIVEYVRKNQRFAMKLQDLTLASIDKAVQWSCWFGAPDPVGSASAEADTAPMAIALCFLKLQ